MPGNQETHTCHLTPPVCRGRHLGVLLAENRVSVCHQRLSPFLQRRPQRQHAHTKPFISKPPCWKAKFRSSILSRKHVTNMRNTREHPTCSQCGARGSKTGKNTPRSSEVQKKTVFNTSSCLFGRSSGNIYNFIDVPPSTRVSVMFEPEAPGSKVQRPRCAIPAALLVAMDGGCAPTVKHTVR